MRIITHLFSMVLAICAMVALLVIPRITLASNSPVPLVKTMQTGVVVTTAQVPSRTTQIGLPYSNSSPPGASAFAKNILSRT